MAETRLNVGDLAKLGWLADAPLFIDGEQVKGFYDAVVRPEAEEKKITLSLKSLEAEKTTVGGEVQAEVSVAKWLTTIFPFLDAKVGGKATGASEEQTASEETRTIELQPISSSQRQLVQLTLHYLLGLPSRLKIVSDPGDPSWSEAAFIQALPRALVFIDLPPKTYFVPMAVELSNGNVIPIHEEVAKAFTGGEKNPNPRPAYDLPEAKKQEGWDRYWKWFADHFKSIAAMETVENLVREGGSRIRWIDYRVPLFSRGTFVKMAHLHVCGRGEHDTGVFAYNLIERGYRYGVRVVGTLKSDPDLNVLAIFEK